MKVVELFAKACFVLSHLPLDLILVFDFAKRAREEAGLPLLTWVVIPPSTSMTKDIKMDEAASSQTVKGRGKGKQVAYVEVPPC